MCQYIETIRVEHGELHQLRYHEARLQRTRYDLWGQTEHWSIRDLIDFPLPQSRHKLRMVYSEQGIDEITCVPYSPRPVHSLLLVKADGVDYRYKSVNRSRLQEAYDRRGDCDDVLMVRGGFLTDTSIANIALSDGSSWVTPQYPLLEGTQRARLLEEGLLNVAPLRIEDLSHFRAIRLLNAMLDWEETELPIECLVGREYL